MSPEVQSDGEQDEDLTAAQAILTSLRDGTILLDEEQSETVAKEEDLESLKLDDSVTLSRAVRNLLFSLYDPSIADSKAGGLSPDLVARLVEAAQRGLAARRARVGPLPSLLEYRRTELRIDLPSISKSLSIKSGELAELESGNSDIRSLGPLKIAQWIKFLDVRPSDAAISLRAALRISARRNESLLMKGVPQPDADDEALSSEDEELIAKVLEFLGDESEEP